MKNLYLSIVRMLAFATDHLRPHSDY